MERRITERAFAKLNLTLDVTGRRDDGYHDMDMIMQSVDLCDTVEITVTDAMSGIHARADVDGLPRDLDNLAGRAADVFLRRAGLAGIGAQVYITKRIPDRAGMAGGSSDAAAVIRGLDRLLGTCLSQNELSDMALSVGSDVPYCLRGGTALARGRGEILSGLPEMPECGILIVKPEFSVSTPALFAALDSTPVTARPDTARAVEALGSGNIATLGASMVNIFEQALPERERRLVVEIKTALTASGALGAMMTGTGSAVFGIFPTLAEAESADLSRFVRTFAVMPAGRVC